MNQDGKLNFRKKRKTFTYEYRFFWLLLFIALFSDRGMEELVVLICIAFMKSTDNLPVDFNPVCWNIDSADFIALVTDMYSFNGIDVPKCIKHIEHLGNGLRQCWQIVNLPPPPCICKFVDVVVVGVGEHGVSIMDELFMVLLVLLPPLPAPLILNTFNLLLWGSKRQPQKPQATNT